ncbi:hypothetical protein [Nocardioides mangrovi]|uniref:Secreted protein n=1 Tax=Nocardioides mangrovi TaxID=2874580 RepID=A0ABS7U8Q9_9ACTN|nr:hypothetical protein [Nocardioides mangrovi]MBZ5737264.1 hypothetical protein [Nocardioides mangrovi]
MTSPGRAAAAVLTILTALSSLVLPVGSAAANDEDAGSSSGSWHHVHFHINAYRTGDVRTGSCEGSWRDNAGICQGWAESRTWYDSYPFRSSTQVRWASTPTRCRDAPGGRDSRVWRHEVYVYASHLGTGQNSWLCGWGDEGWHTMVVTGGEIRGYDGYFHEVQRSSGVLADREHVPGGPLYVFLDASRDQGAVIGFRGWLRY